MKQEKVLNDLLIFMKNKAEKNGASLDMSRCNFSSKNELGNAEGEDLIVFKKEYKYKNNEIILQSLKKAITDVYIKHTVIDKLYSALSLTNSGAARAESLKYNKKNHFKKVLSYFTDKLLVPLVVAIVSVMLLSYINKP